MQCVDCPMAAARRHADEPLDAVRPGARLEIQEKPYFFCFFVAAASISALVMPMTRPLSPFAKLDGGTVTRTLPVLTTTPFEVTDSTLPTVPPFWSRTEAPALMSAEVAGFISVVAGAGVLAGGVFAVPAGGFLLGSA